MRVARTAAWAEDEIAAFLADFKAPLRLAATTESQFPLLCSLWFRFADGYLYCATQADSTIARALRRDSHCAFEAAPNEPPYFGVRGRGHARLTTEGASEELEGLIDRYLGNGAKSLRRWLLSRADNEIVIAIEIERITAWDFRERMSG